MSYQLEVLKVLASHPGGRATVAAIKQDLVFLASPEWGKRIRDLGKTVPHLDVFSSGYIVRHSDCWQITGAGVEFLTQLEMGTLATSAMVQSDPDIAEDFTVEPLADRPQRPFQQHRPTTRGVMRRMQRLASNWLGKKSG